MTLWVPVVTAVLVALGLWGVGMALLGRPWPNLSGVGSLSVEWWSTRRGRWAVASVAVSVIVVALTRWWGLAPLGLLVWLSSGSLARTGEEISTQVARSLAFATWIESVSALLRATGQPLKALRESVASPTGPIEQDLRRFGGRMASDLQGAYDGLAAMPGVPMASDAVGLLRLATGKRAVDGLEDLLVELAAELRESATNLDRAETARMQFVNTMSTTLRLMVVGSAVFVIGYGPARAVFSEGLAGQVVLLFSILMFAWALQTTRSTSELVEAPT